MQLRDLFGSAYGRASEIASTARQQAQERLVVIGSRDSGLSIKLALVAGLGLFLVGGVIGYRWGGSEFRAFLADAEALGERVKAENRRLAAEISRLRGELNAQEQAQSRADQDFVSVINAPGSNQCVVDVGSINAIIAEASK